MLNFRTLARPKANEDMESKELLFMACGNATWYGHFRRQLDSFLQMEHTFTIGPSNLAHSYLPKGVENLHPCKNLRTNGCK